MNFTALVNVEVFGGEVGVNFSSMLELVNSGRPGMYTLTPHPMGTACLECVGGKQASD